jgi:hypothetical protein
MPVLFDVRRCTVLAALLFGTVPLAVGEAQLVTVGAGALLSERSPEPVLELHVASAPVHRIRAYGTFSWTDASAHPVVITAAERQILGPGIASVGLGGGLLWLKADGYKAYPILVSSVVAPLGIPRTSVVAIASTQPFQDFAWSLILKASVLVWLAR